MKNENIDYEKLEFKQLDDNDVKALCYLFANAFNESMNETFLKAMQKRFRDGWYKTYGYMYNGKLIAAVHLSFFESKQAYIEKMGVHKNYQCQKVGLNLLKTTFEKLKQEGIEKYGLECWAKVSGFYNKLGFETVHTVPGPVDFRERYMGDINVMNLTIK